MCVCVCVCVCARVRVRVCVFMPPLTGNMFKDNPIDTLFADKNVSFNRKISFFNDFHLYIVMVIQKSLIVYQINICRSWFCYSSLKLAFSYDS